MAAYDASALEPLITDDIVWWSPPSASRFGIPRPIVGKDEVVRLFTGGLGVHRAGTITWEVHQLVADDTNIAVGFTRRSLTAAGKPYENQYCFMLCYVDGRIAEGWEFTDTADAFAPFD